MAAPSPGAQSAPAPVASTPVLPLDIIDASTQRLYAVSLFGLLQSYKAYHFALASVSSGGSWSNFLLYALLDAGLLWVINLLRIPRLDLAKTPLYGTIAFLVGLDYLLLGSWSFAGFFHAFAPAPLTALLDKQLAIDEVSVRPDKLVRAIDHIIGSFTVDILPFATARLDAKAAQQCLSPLMPAAAVSLPLLLNNTGKPSHVAYSIADFATGERRFFELDKAELSRMQTAAKAKSQTKTGEDALEEEWKRWTTEQPVTRPTEASTMELALRVNSTGLVRLERVLDANRDDVDVVRGVGIAVTQCPILSWARAGDEVHGCQGDTAILDAVFEGVPPFSIKYTRRNYGEIKPHVLSMSDLVGPAKRTTAREGDKGYEWAVTQRVDVPIRAPFSHLGRHEYTLTEVKDALGHIHHPSRYEIPYVAVHGHDSARARFSGSAGQVRGLAKGGTVDADIHLVGGAEQTWTGSIAFSPDDPQKESWKRQVNLLAGVNPLRFAHAGTYELSELKGQHCPGIINAPSQIVVSLLPEPALSADFEEIKDECAGAVGIRVALSMTGTPPYTVHYAMRRAGAQEQQLRHTASSDRGEIVIQPGQYGKYTVELMRLDDVNYKGIKIRGSASADIRPLASAQFGRTHVKLFSCDGDSLKVPIKLVGEAPFTLRVEVASASKRQFLDVTAQSLTHELTLNVPKDVAKTGGRFSASIISIQDARGCKRSLTVPALNVDVERTLPTARFAKAGELASFREGHQATLLLVLTGQSPWTVRYRFTSEDGTSETLNHKFEGRSAILSVTRPGRYVLLGVSDSHCSGEIITDADSVSVTELPRPTFALVKSSVDGALDHSGGTRRVCRDQKASVSLDLVGTPPFVLQYDAKHKGHTKRAHLTAAEHSAELVFDTSSTGSHQYTFVGMADSLFAEAGDLQQSVKGAAKVSVEVLPLPEAAFTKATSISVCEGSQLGGKAHDKHLTLTGAKPFDLDFHLVEPNRSNTKRLSVKGVTASNWASSLDYVFAQPGRYELAVVRVQDNNGCLQMYDAGAAPRMVIEVAATASIASTEDAIEHCIGDSIDFLLQGSSPWSVTYHWTPDDTGKLDEKTVSILEPTFSRLASAAGLYRIVSVGHRDSTCRSSSDLVKRIHSIPTVRIHSGSKIREAIHAGDQAEIVFHLTGTPPFSFTYQRSAIPPGGKMPEVLEKHTVNDIHEHTYKVHTSSAGTWSVTSISDAFCSYPPGHHKLIEG